MRSFNSCAHCLRCGLSLECLREASGKAFDFVEPLTVNEQHLLVDVGSVGKNREVVEATRRQACSEVPAHREYLQRIAFEGKSEPLFGAPQYRRIVQSRRQVDVAQRHGFQELAIVANLSQVPRWWCRPLLKQLGRRALKSRSEPSNGKQKLENLWVVGPFG